MQEFSYMVIRRGAAGTLYHAGFENRTSLWTAHRSEAAVYGGERASVLCENLSFRGIWATFILA